MKTQIAFWKILNYKNILENGYDDAEGALALVEETDYYIVNEDQCISMSEGCCFLLTRSGTVLTNVEEIPYELVKDLK